MSDLPKILARSTVFGAVAFASGPLAPFVALLAKAAEDLWSEQEKAELVARISALEAAIGRDPAAVRANLDALSALVASHAPPGQIRHVDSCMAVVRALNTRSQNAVDWDPHLDEEDLLEILRAVPGVDDPAREVDLVIHELKRVGLIQAAERNITTVGPADDFFAKTDALFQPWNPRVDARVLCHRARAHGDRIHLRAFDEQLGWGPRRMNAAIAYLKSNRYGDNFEGVRDGAYIDHAVMLTVGARFFEEEEPPTVEFA